MGRAIDVDDTFCFVVSGWGWAITSGLCLTASMARRSSSAANPRFR